MTSFSVMLTSVETVKTFVDAATLFPCEIDVKSGRYLINAKSIMGLFSLDLSTTLTVEVHGDDAQGEAFRQSVSQFVV
jgi:Phosphotransferase system, HPr-related proteins